jgi:hypothetical protein
MTVDSMLGAEHMHDGGTDREGLHDDDEAEIQPAGQKID